MFKRRIIQVARKFGAISRWADYSSITLGQLKKSFEGTAIFEEAVKDTLDRDMDLEHLKEVVFNIDEGEIEVLNLSNKDVSPIARIGIEKFGERTNLIPSERIDRFVIETAKARLLNEVRTLVCTNCWNYVHLIKINDLPEKPSCPNCDSGEIGVLNETEDLVSKICLKKPIISSEEKKLKEKAVATAKLVNIYGRMAILVLAGKRLGPSDVVTILSEKDAYLRLFELIIDAERKALSRRFW
jgi:ATP-dependent Lhr-like helicase